MFFRFETKASLHYSRGNRIWKAAFVLRDFLISRQDDFDFSNVLELGSGTGFLGLSLAQKIESLHIVLSEQRDVTSQELLKSNVERNKDALVGSVESVDVLDFLEDGSGCKFRCSERQWSLVIGSDLIYTKQLVVGLSRTLNDIIDVQGNSMVYCHTKGRFGDLDRIFVNQLTSYGNKDLETVEFSNL